MENSKEGWELRNSLTGETQPIKPPSDDKKDIPYYRIERLRMKIWNDGMNFVENRVIHSNLDIRLLNHIKDKADLSNRVCISQTELAKQFGTSRNKISTFLKKLIDIGFIHKEQRGIYTINPYVYCSFTAWFVGGSKNVSYLQNEWRFDVGMPPESKMLKYVDTLIGEKPDTVKQTIEEIAG
jgi:biotin operon repressor